MTGPKRHARIAGKQRIKLPDDASTTYMREWDRIPDEISERQLFVDQLSYELMGSDVDGIQQDIPLKHIIHLADLHYMVKAGTYIPTFSSNKKAVEFLKRRHPWSWTTLRMELDTSYDTPHCLQIKYGVV